MDWKVLRSEVAVRPGMRSGWYEVRLTHPETKNVTKYVMKAVRSWYSERKEKEVPQ
jgi:hypothetical protein